MGHYEDQLDAIKAGTDWNIENVRVLSLALGELQRTMKALADAPGWEGNSAEDAKDAFVKMQKKFADVKDTVDAIQTTMTNANTYRAEAAGSAELPSASVDPYWKTAVTVGATVVYPGLGTLAADKALDVIEGFLGNKREDAAKEKVEKLQSGLEEHRAELEKSRLALEDSDSSYKFPDQDTKPPAPSSGPTLPGGGGGPSVPSYPSGGTPSYPATDFGGPGASQTAIVGINDTGYHPGHTPDVPSSEPGWTNVTGPGDGGGNPPSTTDTPSVDGGVDGSLPSIPGSTPGGSYGGGAFGGGGATGSGVLGAGAIGGGSAAALLAGSKMAGSGAAGLGGFGGAGGLGGTGGVGGTGAFGRTGGTAGVAGARSSGGLLGQAGEGAAGARGSASGASASGTGAAGGRPGMMMGGQGQGGSEEKQKGQGLGGPMAPKLEDDDQSGPRSKGAGAGGRS